MKSFRERLYLSTIGEDACALAAQHGLGLEIAEYCTAENMDGGFARADDAVRRALAASDRFVFHCPFSELCPAAIDPLARELTEKRYRQAAALSRNYGILRLVIHAGYIPLVYFPSWFTERSVLFWRRFLESFPPDMEICLENVMEDGPDMLVKIAAAVDDPRFRLCLDLGHANAAMSRTPPLDWIGPMAPWLSHVHLHDNRGDWDLHAPLGEGTVPVREALERLEREAPGVTYTVENMTAAPSVRWLTENGFLEAK